MQMLFIRHGKTKGNTEGRYIGRMDEPLCEEGIHTVESLCGLDLPEPDTLFVSPMKRCRETAGLLFPQAEQIVIDDFREYDFGAFEGKNYEELKTDPVYVKWLAGNGDLPFPAGEGMDHFRRRVCAAFEKTLFHLQPDEEKKVAVYVVHGGTIMSIFAQYDSAHKGYYDYQCKNAEGYIAEWDGAFPCTLVHSEKIGK